MCREITGGVFKRAVRGEFFGYPCEEVATFATEDGGGGGGGGGGHGDGGRGVYIHSTTEP